MASRARPKPGPHCGCSSGLPRARRWRALPALLALETLGLLTSRVDQIAQGLVAGIAAAAFGHGVARGAVRRRKAATALMQEDDETARCFHNHLLWASRVLGVVIPLQVDPKILFAPLVITIATNALFAAPWRVSSAIWLFAWAASRMPGAAALSAATWTHPSPCCCAAIDPLALARGLYRALPLSSRSG